MSSIVDRARRGLFAAAGLVAVAIGGIGIVVPGLPSTVFFIIAAWCFSRSSRRLEAWLLGLPRIGPTVRRYRAGHGMPASAKRWAIGSILVFSGLSIWLVGTTWLRVVVAVVAAAGVWFVGWRVPTDHDGRDPADTSP